MLLSSNRHSRAGGNPGLFFAELAWIPPFAGMTELRGVFRSGNHLRMRIFEEGTKDTKVRKLSLFLRARSPW